MTAQMTKSTFIQPFSFAKALIASLVLSTTLVGHAGGPATGGSSEWTQIMNNVELAVASGEQARIVSNTMLQYETQLKQYYNELKQLEKLTNVPRNADEILKRFNSVSAYRNRLNQAQGSVSKQVEVMKKRMTEAQLSGLPWEEYVKQEKELVEQKNARAIQRLEYEQEVFQAVEKDYEFAREIEPRIDEASGVTGALQVLNKQMNRLVTQNAKLTETIAIGNSEDPMKMQQEAAQKAYDDKVKAYTRAANQARRERQLKFGETIGK